MVVEGGALLQVLTQVFLRARKRPHVAIPVLSLLLGLLLWYVLDQLNVFNPVLFAGPERVARSLWMLAASGELWIHLTVSGIEFVTGFGAAVILGAAIGYVLGMNRTLEVVFNPYLIALYSAPRAAFIMIVLAWFGIGLFAKGLLVFLGAFFPICVNVLTGTKEVDPNLLRAARAFGAGPLGCTTKVIIPYTVPYLFAGLRLGIGRGLVGVFVAEMYGSTQGIGAMILRAGAEMNTGNLFAGVLVLALASILLTEGVRLLGDRCMPWRHQTEL